MSASAMPQPHNLKRRIFGVCNLFLVMLGVAWLLEPLRGSFGGYWERILVVSIGAPLGYFLGERWSRKT